MRVENGHDPEPRGRRGEKGTRYSRQGGKGFKKKGKSGTKVVGLYREEPLGRPTPGLESLRAKDGVYQPYPVTSRN